MKAVLSPSVAMGATATAVGEKRGILFGPERTGLDNDEVALADAIITFPSSPTYASLNLSQAVLLCGYEWFKAAHGDAPPPPTIPRPQSPPAQREMLLAFFDYPRGQAGGEWLFPAGDQEARDAAKPPQHLPSHGADAAGRTHIVGGGGSLGRVGRGSRSRRASGRGLKRLRRDDRCVDLPSARLRRSIGSYMTRAPNAAVRPAPNDWERDDGSEIDRGRSHRISERFHHRGRHAASGGEAGDGQDQHACEHGRDGQKGARTRRDDRLRANQLHRRLPRAEPELPMASSRAWSTASHSAREPGARRSSMR